MNNGVPDIMGVLAASGCDSLGNERNMYTFIPGWLVHDKLDNGALQCWQMRELVFHSPGRSILSTRISGMASSRV